MSDERRVCVRVPIVLVGGETFIRSTLERLRTLLDTINAEVAERVMMDDPDLTDSVIEAEVINLLLGDRE